MFGQQPAEGDAAGGFAVRRAAVAARFAAAAGLVVEERVAGAVVAAHAADCVALDVARAGQGVAHGVYADAARVVAVGFRAASRAWEIEWR